MPIYAYKCDSCGHSKDVLQKMSDAPLTDCPQCGQPAFKKQLTAAGFQLKGSGWYVTDFRGGAKPGGEASAGSDSTTASPAAAAAPKPTDAPTSSAASPAPSPAPTPSPAASASSTDKGKK